MVIDIRYLFRIRFGGTIGVIDSYRILQWTLIMKKLHIDSYKVSAVDSNHIVHVGGWSVLAPEDWGL